MLCTSKQNINYKIKKLTEEGIIEQAITVIDIHSLGYMTYRAYIRLGRITDTNLKKIEEDLKNNPNILWLVGISGTWDFELVFVAKNYIEFANQFNEIKNELGEKLVKYNLSMSIVNLHYGKDYLIGKRRKIGSIAYYGHEPKHNKVDKTDIKILIELSKNCRRSNQEIGSNMNISYHTVKARIKRMEELGIIQGHRTKIFIQKLGYKHMKAALYLNPISEKKEKELVAFLSTFPNVTYVVKILGEWQIEIEAEIETEEAFAEILRVVRNRFPMIINDYFTFQVTREIKLNYFPNAEKLLKQMSKEGKR